MSLFDVSRLKIAAEVYPVRRAPIVVDGRSDGMRHDPCTLV